MLVEYIDGALHESIYERLDDGTFVGTVTGLRGVIVNATTLSDCRDRLAEATEEWVLFRIANGTRIPKVDGLTVVVTRVKLATRHRLRANQTPSR